MPYKDKTKQRDAMRRWYARNRIEVLRKQAENREVAAERNKQSRRKKREWLNALKEANPCMDCGVSYPARVMDFHHVREEKIGNLGTMLSVSASWEELKAEVAKCEIICANCHRLRH